MTNSKYIKESPEWLQIRANNANWFSPRSMRTWGSKVYWQTLSHAKYDNNWYFISSEDNWDNTVKKYTIRVVDAINYDLDTYAFQAYETYPEALAKLKEITSDSYDPNNEGETNGE